MNQRDVGLGLCTVGSTLFAVGASKVQISELLKLPSSAFEILLLVGGAMAAAGVAVIVSSLLADRVRQAMEQVIYGDPDSKYLCTYARPTDLAGLYELYARYFGADVPEIELMRSWMAKCDSAFILVQKVAESAGLTTRKELVGSFKLLPLTAKGVRALDLGQVTGSTFRPEHVAGSRTRPSGYYVGDVVATTRFGRAVVMAQLYAASSPAVRAGVTVYARPLTKDGLRVMKKHRFVQASDGKSSPEIGRICKMQTLVYGEGDLLRKAKPYRLERLGEKSDS